MEAILSVKNLNVTFNTHRILQDISFDIMQGDVVAIVGPNGSGKTTLLKAILGLIPSEGEIRMTAEKIGYVPQRLEFDRTIPLTVQELLSMYGSKKDANLLEETLSLVGAEQLIQQRVSVLSGGEFQRVLLALALLNEPQILFLDEPVASIDMEGANEIYSLIGELRKKRQITTILVSHDIDIVFRYATTVLCINHQLLCKGIPQEALTPEMIQKLYGGEHTVYTHQEKPHA